MISIHALLAESDPLIFNVQAREKISIHALLAESDYDTSSLMQCQVKFLSTLSLRRATVHYDNYNLHCVISIHALLAESDLRVLDGSKSSIISIHALLAESDPTPEPPRVIRKHFYPRSPCGERPDIRPPNLSSMSISIHALLAESDNPTRGEHHANSQFLSTLSLRRATSTCARRLKIVDNFYPRSPCGERLKNC